MKYLLLLTTIVFCFSFTPSSTIEEAPVKWEFKTKKIDDNTAYLIMETKIAKGWKIYGKFPYMKKNNSKLKCDPDLGPACMEVEFEEGTEMLVGKTVSTQKAYSGYDKVFKGKIVYYKNKVQLRQKIKKTSKAKNLKGYVYYMTCNNEKCMPPEYVEFSVAFPK